MNHIFLSWLNVFHEYKPLPNNQYVSPPHFPFFSWNSLHLDTLIAYIYSFKYNYHFPALPCLYNRAQHTCVLWRKHEDIRRFHLILHFVISLVLPNEHETLKKKVLSISMTNRHHLPYVPSLTHFIGLYICMNVHWSSSVGIAALVRRSFWLLVFFPFMQMDKSL